MARHPSALLGTFLLITVVASRELSFEEADANGDGVIDRHELARVQQRVIVKAESSSKSLGEAEGVGWLTDTEGDDDLGDAFTSRRRTPPKPTARPTARPTNMKDAPVKLRPGMVVTIQANNGKFCSWAGRTECTSDTGSSAGHRFVIIPAHGGRLSFADQSKAQPGMCVPEASAFEVEDVSSHKFAFKRDSTYCVANPALVCTGAGAAQSITARSTFTVRCVDHCRGSAAPNAADDDCSDSESHSQPYKHIVYKTKEYKNQCEYNKEQGRCGITHEDSVEDSLSLEDAVLGEAGRSGSSFSGIKKAVSSVVSSGGIKQIVAHLNKAAKAAVNTLACSSRETPTACNKTCTGRGVDCNLYVNGGFTKRLEEKKNFSSYCAYVADHNQCHRGNSRDSSAPRNRCPKTCTGQGTDERARPYTTTVGVVDYVKEYPSKCAYYRSRGQCNEHHVKANCVKTCNGFCAKHWKGYVRFNYNDSPDIRWTSAHIAVWESLRKASFGVPPKRISSVDPPNSDFAHFAAEGCGKDLRKQFGACAPTFGGGGGCYGAHARGPCWGEVEMPKKRVGHGQKDLLDIDMATKLSDLNYVTLRGTSYKGTRCGLKVGWRIATCTHCCCSGGLVKFEKHEEQTGYDDNDPDYTPDQNQDCADWFTTASTFFSNYLSVHHRLPLLRRKVNQCYNQLSAGSCQ